MAVSTGSTRFGTPDRGRSTIVAVPGRICQSDDCSTILSVYNRSVWCSIHEQPGHSRSTVGRVPPR
jgi:hypothetical protein